MPARRYQQQRQQASNDHNNLRQTVDVTGWPSSQQRHCTGITRRRRASSVYRIETVNTVMLAYQYSAMRTPICTSEDLRSRVMRRGRVHDRKKKPTWPENQRLDDMLQHVMMVMIVINDNDDDDDDDDDVIYNNNTRGSGKHVNSCCSHRSFAYARVIPAFNTARNRRHYDARRPSATLLFYIMLLPARQVGHHPSKTLYVRATMPFIPPIIATCYALDISALLLQTTVCDYDCVLQRVRIAYNA